MSVSERRTALITGASSGFGVEFTRLFGADGWNVVMVARSGPAMETIASEVQQRHGVDISVSVMDLSEAGRERRAGRVPRRARRGGRRTRQ